MRSLLSQAAGGCSIIPRINALNQVSEELKASLSLEASIVSSSKSASSSLGLGIAAFEAAAEGRRAPSPWRKMKKMCNETKV